MYYHVTFMSLLYSLVFAAKLPLSSSENMFSRLQPNNLRIHAYKGRLPRLEFTTLLHALLERDIFAS